LFLAVFKFFLGDFWGSYGAIDVLIYYWHSGLSAASFNCATAEGAFLTFGAGVRFSPARRFLNWMSAIYKRRAARRVEILTKAKGKLHDDLKTPKSI